VRHQHDDGRGDAADATGSAKVEEPAQQGAKHHGDDVGQVMVAAKGGSSQSKQAAEDGTHKLAREEFFTSAKLLCVTEIAVIAAQKPWSRPTQRAEK